MMAEKKQLQQQQPQQAVQGPVPRNPGIQPERQPRQIQRKKAMSQLNAQQQVQDSEQEHGPSSSIRDTTSFREAFEEENQNKGRLRMDERMEIEKTFERLDKAQPLRKKKLSLKDYAAGLAAAKEVTTPNESDSAPVASKTSSSVEDSQMSAILGGSAIVGSQHSWQPISLGPLQVALPNAAQVEQPLDHRFSGVNQQQNNQVGFDSTRIPSEAQIPAASPSRPQYTPSTTLEPSAPKWGRLSPVIAPAGSGFRAPYVAPAPHRAKKPFVIDISDDDGPEYKGGSSDDDSPSLAEIKPSSFLPKSKKFSLSGSGASKPSTHGSGSSRQSRFNGIIANAKFDPTRKLAGVSLTGSVFDSRNRDPRSNSSRITTPAVKRAADSVSLGYTANSILAGKGHASRAGDMRLDDEQDQEMQRKIYRLQLLKPGAFTALVAKKALMISKGNVDDAAEILMGGAIEISDDGGADRSRGQQSHIDPQMKRQLKVPINSI